MMRSLIHLHMVTYGGLVVNYWRLIIDGRQRSVIVTRKPIELQIVLLILGSLYFKVVSYLNPHPTIAKLVMDDIVELA